MTSHTNLNAQLTAVPAPSSATRDALASIVATGAVLALVALNLRPTVTSVGALLGEVIDGTGMPSAVAALVVAAPGACFSVGGLLAWPVQLRLGTGHTVTATLLALALALALRPTGSPIVFLVGTVVACVAIGILAAVLPVLARSAPRARWTILTTCHTTALGVGSGLGAWLSPHLAAATSWRVAAGAWSVLAAAAALAWLVSGPRMAAQVRPPAAARAVSPLRLAPASTAWALTVYLGCVCTFSFYLMGWLPQLLRDAGIPADTVTRLFIVAMALGIPLAPFVPWLASRLASQAALSLALTAPGVVAVGGLLLAPRALPWVWAVLLGISMLSVVLAVTLIGRRTADPETSGALSSLVHGYGFAAATLLTLAVGLLHTLTGGWQWPLIALIAVLAAQAVTGALAGLPRTVRPA